MRHLACSFLLPLFGVVLGAVSASAAETTTPAPKVDADKVAALVRQLGSDSFEEREEAHALLEKVGKPAVSALEEATKEADLEISSRAKRLLAHINRTDIEVALEAYLNDKDTKLILKLPSWDRFKKVIGEDDTSRQLFVDMYISEGSLLAALDRDPKGFESLFTGRMQQIQQNLYTRFGQANPLRLGQVLALLYAGTDERASINITSFYTMTSLCCQQNIQMEFKNSAGARKLLVRFFEMRADQNTMAQALQVAMQMDLKEMAPIAMKTATNKDTQAWSRAQALLAVGKLGAKEQIKDIEALLADKTNLGQMNVNNVLTTTQMRDVALAAMILLSGQDVMEYDFPYLKAVQINRQYLAYNYFGFTNDAQREAALKKFKASQEKKDDANKDKK